MWSGSIARPSGSSRPKCLTTRLGSECSCASSRREVDVGGGTGAATAARLAGWQVNNKRVRRLWREEGLRVPTRKRKKRLTGIGTHVGAMCPIRPNALWALDFQFDTTIDGRTLKMLNVIDEYTREGLVIKVDRWIDADQVVNVLDRLAKDRGTPPAFVRFDNGPEFVAQWRRRLVPVQRHQVDLDRPRLTLAERLDRVLQRPFP